MTIREVRRDHLLNGRDGYNEAIGMFAIAEAIHNLANAVRESSKEGGSTKDILTAFKEMGRRLGQNATDAKG